mmetsp:Transcript_884/g.1378  ORF Transcript_884/g.1378 Transcript_884/m.1378 type:complete len:248 (-) Transcript_884:3483-4226(-)
MYIGPWQEFKLAQVLKLKNDLYEGTLNNQPRLNSRNLSLHKKNSDSKSSGPVTPSNRSLSSEQHKYPKFNIDTYYKQWKKVEYVMARSEPEQNRKPPLPKNFPRRRLPQNLHKRRINKMRVIYGLNEGSRSPAEEVTTASEERTITPLPPISTKKLSNPLLATSKLLPEPFEEAKEEESKLPQTPKQVFEESYKQPLEKSYKLPEIHKAESEEIKSESEDNVDGLLKWVEELPEEISMGSPDLKVVI